MVKPGRRRELAIQAVQDKGVSIRFACETYGLSETCFRYPAKLNRENIAVNSWQLLKAPISVGSISCGMCFDTMHINKPYEWLSMASFEWQSLPLTEMNDHCERIVTVLVGQTYHLEYTIRHSTSELPIAIVIDNYSVVGMEAIHSNTMNLL